MIRYAKVHSALNQLSQCKERNQIVCHWMAPGIGRLTIDDYRSKTGVRRQGYRIDLAYALGVPSFGRSPVDVRSAIHLPSGTRERQRGVFKTADGMGSNPCHYALRVTTVLIPIASRISWSRAIATV